MRKLSLYEIKTIAIERNRNRYVRPIELEISEAQFKYDRIAIAKKRIKELSKFVV